METYGIEKLGIIHPTAVWRNLTPAMLVEKALARGEGSLSATGALVVNTGKYTGRSPDDKFIVDSKGVHDLISWGKVNVPTTQENFDNIYGKLVAYLQNRELFIFDGFAGADVKYGQKFRVINELASQALFTNQALIRPTKEQLESFAPDFTVIAAPGFKCIPEIDHTHSEAAIMIDYEKKLVIIAGSQYAGEIKKSIFSVMNFILPNNDVFPMHCSANIGEEGDTALFFGLSGTGKTTLSADPSRSLIGDDEHGWSKDGVFNFEGGCYAKCINLSQENEPQIWNAIKFGALVENVIMDPDTRALDFDDDTLTQNTRVGYPVDYIPNAVIPGIGSQPKTVIFLTADAFGVLPPISKLDENLAMYHFVSGYTSKLAGTERGITEPQATFSTCFGAPFLPLDPSIYAKMLGDRVKATGANVFLVNTGWSGGSYGVGKRMSIKYTRAMVSAALNGSLDKVEYVRDPFFNLLVPQSCPNVPAEILDPKKTWADKEAYNKTAKDLAERFINNFKKYTHMPKEIVDAPIVK
ncbi:MAG TPA: phosphoenolpyruvate carboxykinase (ATP) [Oscillospiraceae bacterium]|nr:phosphoenolpyruvate carboxykinase (ATP) [Oscillospiraceae bacterium]HPF56213.1 phosphoenolpyruvate carboxykinase (ATP) [Clostridiales bacterium]HPK34937.1 phosphoenolpyruvate carboxykinase (ATP) [Oscillospiraceae bacterium]HPR75354.1 phosphoenolpyruvate carboxykinase (ATP) [Oscillospiraceae bacterium]